MNAGAPGPDQASRLLLPMVSLGEIAEILFRRIWTVVLVTILATVLTLGYTFLIRGNLWLAEAKILVRLGQEQAPLPTMLADRQVFVATTPGHINSEMELIRSRDLIAALVDRVDLTPEPRAPATSLLGRIKDYARTIYTSVREGFDDLMVMAGLRTRLTPREAAIEAISGSLLLEFPPNANVVTARFFWAQRGVPEAILTEILKLYFERRGAMFQGSQAVAFFTERRRETELRLQEAEARLSAFELGKGISNPDDQRTTLQRRLADAETAVQAARLELEMAETSLRQLQAAQAAGDATLAGVALSGNPLQQSIASELASLGARTAGSQTTLNPQDANVRRQAAEMASLSRQMADQIRAAHAQRSEQLTVRQTQRDAIEGELATLQGELPQWYDLRREVNSARRAYEFNDGKLNDSISVAALEEARIGNVQLVQRATERATPVGVRKSSLILLAMALGLVTGLAWVAVRTFFDHRLYRRQDVEKQLGLRVLATIPRLRQPLPAH